MFILTATSQGEATLFSNWLNTNNTQDQFEDTLKLLNHQNDSKTFQIIILLCNEVMSCSQVEKDTKLVCLIYLIFLVV